MYDPCPATPGDGVIFVSVIAQIVPFVTAEFGDPGVPYPVDAPQLSPFSLSNARFLNSKLGPNPFASSGQPSPVSYRTLLTTSSF